MISLSKKEDRDNGNGSHKILPVALIVARIVRLKSVKLL